MPQTTVTAAVGFEFGAVLVLGHHGSRSGLFVGVKS